MGTSSSKLLQKRFHKERVLITGASGGLGKALALHLACHGGVDLLLLSGRKEETLRQVAEECRKMAAEVEIVIHTCDLTESASVRALGELAVKQRVTVLINNGGISSRSSFVDTSLDVDQQLMQVNFFAGAALAKALVPSWQKHKDQKGLILWISSVQGLFGIPNRTSYAASKFAIQGYCEALQGELTPSGIQVFVASPGYIRTNLSLSAIQGDGSAYGKMDDSTAKGADPMQVAEQILLHVARNKKRNFVVAAPFTAKAAMILRFFAPRVLEKVLVKRFLKSIKEKKE